jgi:hypothetical protein
MTNNELQALAESTARTAEANAQGVAVLAKAISDFVKRTDEFVQRSTAISDDQGADLAALMTGQRSNDAQITALRQDAISDRQAFREQAEADRQAFRDALEADRAEWQANFNAQMEIMRSQLLEMSRINRRIDNLEQAS